MRKTKRIVLRVSPEEFELITSNAKDYGIPTGTYLRLLGVQGGKPFEADQTKKEKLREWQNHI